MNLTPMLALSLFDGQVLGPLVMMLGVCAIPIMGILTRHQRAMAEIIHGRRREDQVLAELEGVKAEMAELKSKLRALDKPHAETDSLKQRLG